MIDSAINKIIEAYGLDVERILPMQTGYRNKNYPLKLASGVIVNLILYKREPGMATTIKSANNIGGFLHNNGFPARHAYDQRIIRVFAPPYEQFAAIYTYLPGETIPWEAYTMAHIKALGQTMSNMHSLLAGQAKDELPNIAEVYTPIIGRMQQYFEDKNVLKAVNTKLNLGLNSTSLVEFSQLMRISWHLPAQQPLHMDFVRSNILFAKNSAAVTGVLDFEKAAYGAPVFDIARTLAFLFVDCKYKTEVQVRKYFLKSGYNKLDLRKTSLPPDAPSTDSKAILSDGGVAMSTPTAEKEVLDGGDAAGVTGILRKSSKYGNANFNTVNVRLCGQSISLLELAINMFLFYDFYKFLRHNPYESLFENEHFARTVDILVNRGVIQRV